MQQIKHTPGPWVITETIEFGSFPFIHIDNEEKEFHVCTIQNMGSEDKANAALIKSTPELFAACVKMYTDIQILYSKQGIANPDCEGYLFAKKLFSETNFF